MPTVIAIKELEFLPLNNQVMFEWTETWEAAETVEDGLEAFRLACGGVAPPPEERRYAVCLDADLLDLRTYRRQPSFVWGLISRVRDRALRVG